MQFCFFFGLNEISESEGMDRSSLAIPENQKEVLRALAKVNSNIIGILSAGSVVESRVRKNTARDCCMDI